MAKAIQFSVPKSNSSSSSYDFSQGFSGGMNISVAADQIAPNQSPNMSDCNYEDGGVPSKRYGFSLVNAESWGESPIQGMHDFYMIGSDTPIFLIAWNGKLYSYNESTDTKTDLCTGDVTSFTDAPVIFFDMGDKCFFLTGSEFLYYDGTNPVSTVESIAYVPVVSLGKKPDGTDGTPNEVFNRISQKWIESFDPDNSSTEFHCSIIYLNDGVTPVTLSENLFTAWLSGVELVEDTDFTFDRETWIATFDPAPPEGTDTLQIQLEATDLMDTTIITDCTNAIEHGGKNNSVVLLTGNPDYPNTIFYCWVYTPTYWPEDYDFNVGGDAIPVTGFGRMNEYLISYKRPGDQSLQWYSEIDVDTDGDIFYNTYQLNDQYGCIAPRTILPAQNGLLALSDQGVIWTWPELVKGHYNCKIVSRNINGKNGIAEGLLDNSNSDLKNAFAAIYNNKYLLHVGSKTWVLDLDYTDLGQNIFCWYPYAGLYASSGKFLVRDQVFYMAHNASGIMYKEERTDLALQFLDNEDAIDAWWTSPIIFAGNRNWIKKYDKLLITFKGQPRGDHLLSIITDQGMEEIPLIIQFATTFDYGNINYAAWTYGAPLYPSTQPEKIGYKGEYLQWKIRNNTEGQGMTLLAQSIRYSPLKMIK